MSVLGDIGATYRGPRRVVRRLLAAGPREDRALAILMAACVLVFVAQWPRLARQAHLLDQDLPQLLGGTLMAWLFIAPLLFYVLAFVAWGLMRLLGGKGAPHEARIALFWAFLASSPLILLTGLVAGFIGPGPGLSLVGFAWFVVFAWFWLSGMAEAWGST
ncbi:YIP1 family protein [Marimonas lutisalis]|uniref:YIP1 family protein n=1 Tax=Marimonas lutisalis TaxID=2545756 RepID=UPI0010F8034D|nr:YIP1 family protein [Marimonas lutisalis]